MAEPESAAAAVRRLRVLVWNLHGQLKALEVVKAELLRPDDAAVLALLTELPDGRRVLNSKSDDIGAEALAAWCGPPIRAAVGPRPRNHARGNWNRCAVPYRGPGHLQALLSPHRCSFAELTTSTRSLRFAAVHVPNAGMGPSNDGAVRSMGREVLDQLRDLGALTIVGGDFNREPYDPVVMDRDGWNAHPTRPLSTGVANLTWELIRWGSAGTFLRQGRWSWLDQLLVDDELADVRSAVRVRQDLNAKRLSNHQPVEAVFGVELGEKGDNLP